MSHLSRPKRKLLIRMSYQKLNLNVLKGATHKNNYGSNVYNDSMPRKRDASEISHYGSNESHQQQQYRIGRDGAPRVKKARWDNPSNGNSCYNGGFDMPPPALMQPPLQSTTSSFTNGYSQLPADSRLY